MPTQAKRIPYLRMEKLQKPYPIPRHVTIQPIQGRTPPPRYSADLLRTIIRRTLNKGIQYIYIEYGQLLLVSVHGKLRPRLEKQTPCHYSFSDGIFCGSHRDHFAARDHLRSNLGIISGRDRLRSRIICGAVQVPFCLGYMDVKIHQLPGFNKWVLSPPNRLSARIEKKITKSNAKQMNSESKRIGAERGLTGTAPFLRKLEELGRTVITSRECSGLVQKCQALPKIKIHN